METTETVKTTKRKVTAKSKTEPSKLAPKHKIIIALIVVVAAAITTVIFFDNSYHLTAASQESLRNRNKIQTVFLNNGQVYFGRLSKFGFNQWKLENAHYLRTEQVPVAANAEDGSSTTTATTQQTTLMKVSQDLHSPENTIYIPDNNILFWQNLQSNSAIAKAILENKVK